LWFLRWYWVHPLNQRRRQQGHFHHLVAELRLHSQHHHQYFRMSVEQMDELLSLIGPELTRQSTNYRAAIEPKQRLAVGLRYLASGESMVNLAFSYRLGHATVMNSVHMVCAAIEKVMMEKFLTRRLTYNNTSTTTVPKSVLQLQKYFLSHLVDADNRFRIIQVGDFRRTSDGGVYARLELGRGMKNNTLHVPPSTSLPGAAHLGNVPFVMVGDAAFPLKPFQMRPYPRANHTYKKRIFNYRLSRARMVVENAFGILSAKRRIFLNRINMQPKNVDTLVMAACILHNFLIAPSENQRLLDEAEQLGRHMAPVRHMGGNRASTEACNVREVFCTFFNSPKGSISWQDRMV
uniref:DDE Tnp4 domain-containing protein n=1 Tax=Sinocyclocheilus anshuiensis TaxID=1608454 RepID=A0A671Q543_9TELE